MTDKKTNTELVRERIASKIMVDCGYDSEFPCPHNIPLHDCPHEDKDICIWQLEQADAILADPDILIRANNQALPIPSLGIPHSTYESFLELVKSGWIKIEPKESKK